MAEGNELRDPWLVAVWPGMGQVAMLAGTFLVQQLEAQPVAELSAKEFFEVQDVDVKNGVASASPLPQSMFFEWRDPRGQRDLLIFIGHAQPSTGGYVLCQKLVDYAVQRGVRRFFTFAAMANPQLQLGVTPKVYVAATNLPTLRAVRRSHVELLKEGQISGLNGVLLAAGAERGMRGACLLGELPYFAGGVLNPRAARAVLEVFAELAGLELDYKDLDRRAVEVEQELKQWLERMSRAAGEAASELGEEWKHDASDDEDDGGGEATPGDPEEPRIDERTRRNLERLFDRASQDRSKAFELKQELDRLGVFSIYENRFLDLFRKAE